MTYTIKDISKMFGISIYTIRFYDKEGLLPFVMRNKSGNRVFTESDVSLFRTICCLKNTGMQLKDIKKYIDFCMEGTSTIDSRKELLLEHQEVILNQINELNENLDLIHFKIERYSSPDSVQIINEERKKFYDEKRKNNLL
ncbi:MULTISPECIES: MerR family transcriptional regulator [Clostridium]|uniref:MerR family transcriptional regulator n=4 Tax=Clostridium TaxID=1485 RepID=A0AAE2RQE0_CLOBE|nr:MULTISPECIES: MerR family transcriptional regulator [Clostridium]ABR35754.1 putative transcriptional regulator, MerR family [Clostridium beijerinckii NCIMB 8052]AIU03641.1 MerR family transcriptional regulator [Clostridium beijerinckii ATCC 35702]AVK47667.1 MerR family transcriptional regulator [Clostridium sp. MF28]MBC2457881.1 MerR family transcriptional regulator [Clostridium beijerinckii]MBC2475108.1 MerR family transcriptional regulator [Clostridium beijerinckii]